jgi:TRAP-type C4-dicarboxylate transport system permease large subunit
VLIVEMAELSPPVGFNLFVLQAMTGATATTSRARACRSSCC